MVPKLIATYFTCFQAMMAEIIAILGLEIQNATKFACETSETLFYRDAYSSFFGKLELAGETIYMYIVCLYICITFKISTFIVSCLTLVAMRVVPTDLRNNSSIDYRNRQYCSASPVRLFDCVFVYFKHESFTKMHHATNSASGIASSDQLVVSRK